MACVAIEWRAVTEGEVGSGRGGIGEVAWSTWLISDIKQANDRPHYGDPQPQMGPLCKMRDAAVKQSSREKTLGRNNLSVTNPLARVPSSPPPPLCYTLLPGHTSTRAINHVRCVKKAAGEGAT